MEKSALFGEKPSEIANFVGNPDAVSLILRLGFSKTRRMPYAEANFPKFQFLQKIDAGAKR